MKRRFDPSDLDEAAGPGKLDPDTEMVLEAIEEMRGSGEFDWADGTLTGICDNIERWRGVTPGQVKALNNIRESRKWDEIELFPRR